jgi:ribosome-associated protein
MARGRRRDRLLLDAQPSRAPSITCPLIPNHKIDNLEAEPETIFRLEHLHDELHVRELPDEDYPTAGDASLDPQHHLSAAPEGATEGNPSEVCHACSVDLEVTSDLMIPASELQWKFSRSSGPGGQHVNTSDSRVQLTWMAAESSALSDEQRTRIVHRLAQNHASGSITVTVSEQRSQLRNREIALQTLRDIVVAALAHPPAPRRATRPTRGSERRRVASKQQRSETKRQRRRPTNE